MKKIFIFLFLTMLSTPAFATSLKLNSGVILEGTIIERTDKMVKFQKNASDVKAIYYLDGRASIDAENITPAAAPVAQIPVEYQPTPVDQSSGVNQNTESAQPESEAQSWAVLHGAQTSSQGEDSQAAGQAPAMVPSETPEENNSQNMEQSQPSEQTLPVEKSEPANNSRLTITSQPTLPTQYASEGIVEGEVASSVMGLKEGSIGQVVLYLVDGINMTVLIKEDTLFEGKKSFEELGSGDVVWVNYVTKSNKKYATRIKVFSRTAKSIRSSVGRFPENIQSQGNEIVKEGEVSDIANLKISMGGKVVSESLGNFRLNYADDMSVTIHVLKDTKVEGLNDNFEKINSGDTVSVTYVIIKHQNFAKSINVLKKAVAATTVESADQ